MYPGQHNTSQQVQEDLPEKMAGNGYSKPSSLNPSHDDKSQPFLCQFITDVRHVFQARLYPTGYYVFEGATSPHIHLSYATSELLGILQFNVPNLAAQLHIDALSLPPHIA